MSSPTTRGFLLTTTASTRLSTLFNTLALGMQLSDIYERNAGRLLEDTSDAAKDGQELCSVCAGARRMYAPGTTRLGGGGVLQDCEACGGTGHKAAVAQPAP